MPEEVQQPTPQPKVTTISKRYNWKKIGLIVLAVSFVAVIIGISYWSAVLNDTSFNTSDAKPLPNLDIKVPTESLKVAKLTPKPKEIVSSDEKTEILKWKTYTSTDLGFSIKYPKDWSYNDKTRYESVNCEPGPGIDDKTVLFDRKSLECFGVAHFGLWPAEFIVFVRSDVWNPLKNIPSEKYKDITVDGEKAVENYKSASSDGPRCTCTRIYVNHRGKGYMIEFENKDLLGNHEKIHDEILSTFKFLD